MATLTRQDIVEELISVTRMRSDAVAEKDNFLKLHEKRIERINGYQEILEHLMVKLDRAEAQPQPEQSDGERARHAEHQPAPAAAGGTEPGSGTAAHLDLDSTGRTAKPDAYTAVMD